MIVSYTDANKLFHPAAADCKDATATGIVEVLDGPAISSMRRIPRSRGKRNKRQRKRNDRGMRERRKGPQVAVAMN